MQFLASKVLLVHLAKFCYCGRMNAPLDQTVRVSLLARRGDWGKIAAEARVSHSWMSKFVNGRIPNPGYATLRRLAECLGVDQPELTQQEAA